MIPVDWAVRLVVRWVAFGASAEQLRYIVGICEGGLPIAKSALQAALLREVYSRACDEDVCTPELQAEVAEVTRFLETATERAMAAFFGALDVDGDGKVTLDELVFTWNIAVHGLDSDDVGKNGAVPAATLLEAMRRAQSTMAELERLQYGVSLAVDGAVAAVDADGDGRVSLQEVVQAPGRIAAWMTVWRDLMVRGKL